MPGRARPGGITRTDPHRTARTDAGGRQEPCREDPRRERKEREKKEQMITWRKTVAALAALPMLAAFVPTAQAAQHTAAPRAAGASSAQSEGIGAAADYETKSALLADFTFESVANRQKGNLNDATGHARAAINGAAATTPGKNGGTALTLGKNNWLSLTAADGGALLKGRHAIALSYDSKANQASSQGWAFYAAPSTTAQEFGKERYVGVMDQTKTLTVERYNNSTGRVTDANVQGASSANWKHVDVVLADGFTALYINGKLQQTSAKTSASPLPSVLGADGGIVQVGKANWVSGEYFTGAIDNVRLYDCTDAAVATALRLAVPSHATDDFTVPVTSNGRAISWASSDKAVAIDPSTGKATVTRPAAGSKDASVRLTATYGSSTTTFDLTVPAQKSDDQKAKEDLNALEIPHADDVRSSITLPATGSVNGTPISWTSSEPSIVSDKASGTVAAGVVHRPSGKDATVRLTATAAGQSRTFALTVCKAVARQKAAGYLFAHFTGTERSGTDEQMYFATSTNGLTWKDLHSAGNPVLTSMLGEKGVRDPYLVRSPEGDRVYLIATDLSIYHRGGWGGHNPAVNGDGSLSLVVWSSDDLVHWGQPRLVDVASKIPGARMAWAPEAYWDAARKQYMVYWSTTSSVADQDPSNADPTDVYYSTTRDFVHFSDPVKWIDRPQSCIDTTMIKADDGWYYRVSGDHQLGVERTKNPYAVTVVSSGDGYNHGSDPDQWEFVGYFRDLVGNKKWTGSYLEGPELFRYNDADVLHINGRSMKYGLMWDQYHEGKGYLPFYSADLGSTDTKDWAQASSVDFGKLKKRHGTILPVSATELKAINDAYASDRTPDEGTTTEHGKNGYLWLYFNASDYEKINYGYSADGRSWKVLNDGKAIMSSSVGTKGIRDPHLLRLRTPDADGNKYVMLGTDLHAEGSASGRSWDQIHASTDLVVAKSKDLVTWTTPKLVPTGLAGKVGNAWAPEAIWDEATGDYLVYWASRDLSTGNSTQTTALKVYKAHTSDFGSFSTPTVWIDQSAAGLHNIIDTTVVKGEDGNYYRFSTSDWWTVVDTASSLDGKWTRLVERDSEVKNGVSTITGDRVMTTTASGLSTHIEGLTAYQLQDGSWMVMADHGGYQGFTIPRLADLRSGGKFTAATGVGFGKKFRHGTVIELTKQEQQDVLAAYDTATAVTPVESDKAGSKPIARYTFDDPAHPGKDSAGSNDLVLHGSAARVTGTVPGAGSAASNGYLRLDGTDGGYASFPKGMFDRRDKLTVQMDVRSEKAGNFFTFAFGKDSDRYFFLRYRSNGELGSHMSTSSWQNETTADATLSGSGDWHKVTVVLDGKSIKEYCDGELVAHNDPTASQAVTVTDLGMGLLAYLGRSFYDDPYFKGAFDNINVWNRALGADEIAAASPQTRTKLTVSSTGSNRQVLSQKTTDGADGHQKMDLVLDYWAPDGDVTGAKTDLSHLALTFAGPEGSAVRLADGSPVPATQDLMRPFSVVVTNAGASTVYDITAHVLDTPVRVSQKDEPGVVDGTGAKGLRFFADPQVFADGGKYYIFPTTDGYSGWRGWQIRCFESTNLVDWKDKGVVIDLKDQNLDGTPDSDVLPHRTQSAWAPAIIKKDGRYYLYFSGNAGKGGTNQTNVAVSDHVDHGYVIQGTAGAKHDGIVADNIDPAVFQDPADPSSRYLAWGQSPAQYARLSDDMLSLVPGTTVRFSSAKNMREGSYLSARKDPADATGTTWIYYYSYSIDDTNSPDYRVAYAYAKGPRLSAITASDWKYGSEILTKDTDKGILGTAHHSILHVPGTDDWYVVYHCFLTDEMRPRGIDTGTHQQIRTGNKRELRIARLTFDKDGRMRTVPVTYEGVPPETTPRVSLIGSAAQGATAVGTTLTAGFNAGWKGVRWQWYRDGAPIVGATGARYTLAAADAGTHVTVRAMGESTTGVLQNAQAGTKGAAPSRTEMLDGDVTVTVAASSTPGETIPWMPLQPSTPGASDHGGQTPSSGSHGTGAHGAGSSASSSAAGTRHGGRGGLVSTGSAVVDMVALAAVLVLAGAAVLIPRHRRAAHRG